MFVGELREYQKDGLNFIINNSKSILAYEMGLGKTIVSIAFCEKFRNKFKDVLIVAPKTLLLQWASEIEKFTDKKDYIIIDGSKSKRSKLWGDNSFYKLVNYEKFRTDAEPFEREWDITIFDECTKIKNVKSKVTKKLWKLKSNMKIGLTGTPIHNSPLDIFGIFSIINPYKLGKYFWFRKQFLVEQSRELVNGRVFNEVVGYKNLSLLHEKIKPFMLRKRKDEVLDELPEIIYENITVKLNNKIMNKYYDILEVIKEKSKEGKSVIGNFIGLKLLSDCPKLLNISESEELRSFGLPSDGEKVEALIDFLSSHIENNKVVVFTQYKKMGEIIKEKFVDDCFFVSGDDNDVEKDDKINLFKQGDVNVLVATDCLAYGINLQEANIIINYDLPYNPAVYNQRISRLHRMGQKKSVLVIDFVALYTIEEKIIRILRDKINLNNAVVEGNINEQNLFKVLLEDIRFGKWKK